MPRIALIRTSFTRTTPESAQDGDWSSHGWVDEEGETMAEDAETGANVVDSAIQFLYAKGACHASTYPTYSPHTWYFTESETIDWGTGEEESRAFHLKGFTEDEERRIYAAVTARPRVVR